MAAGDESRRGGFTDPKQSGDAAGFELGEHIGVMLVQQESNSFALRPANIGEFTIHTGAEADFRLARANSEFAGACEELRLRGATVVPLLYAHAMPSGPLDDASYSQLRDLVVAVLRDSDLIDGLIVCLHGALSSTIDPSGDRGLLQAIRDEVGDQLPVALSLDLHANATAELVELAQVVTGYRTNPHVDQAATGRRAAALLCAVMGGDLLPTMAVATCPAIFPDESLRIPAGILGGVLDEACATAGRSIIDVSVFPTQPWLDAPGIGFTTVVVAHDDRRAAAELAHAITRVVWDRRREFVVERLLAPAEALARASDSHVRPFIITESADAPTAGATGDGPAMLHALASWRSDRTVLTTIVDAPAVFACHEAGVGAMVTLCVGGSLDPRWAAPARVDGEVVRIGDGEYRLTGVGYNGIAVSMGRFAVVRRGTLQVLLTELPAWSADPGTWRHAGLDPCDVDVLVLRSCTDYMANFPASAATAVVADVPGAATPRLRRLTFERCDVVPFPVDPEATY